MNFDTKANIQGRSCVGTAIHIGNEPLLIERLQAFGLIESNGKGGWQLTECCEAGLAVRGRHGCIAKNPGGRSSMEATHALGIGYPIEFWRRSISRLHRGRSRKAMPNDL